ncbi:hypothetical protein HNQ77_002344 [Silvibacterium bohemicum]|uniref:PqqD family protein n=1 Tax=Silvibacterium bohemicum TaxID=1577686 RepID=A0A841JSK7_9BACT|nr:PqqD family protein [Silvibacterium bohemicum]MBB6144392.1 hypothetical protein [Silvibacterium bohemicum]
MGRPAPQLRSIVDQDGAVVLNSARNQITSLDAMGGYIWRRLELGMAREEIVHHLVEQTGEDVATVERDINEFFLDLASRSLLTDVPTTLRPQEGR